MYSIAKRVSFIANDLNFLLVIGSSIELVSVLVKVTSGSLALKQEHGIYASAWCPGAGLFLVQVLAATTLNLCPPTNRCHYCSQCTLLVQDQSCMLHPGFVFVIVGRRLSPTDPAVYQSGADSHALGSRGWR